MEEMSIRLLSPMGNYMQSEEGEQNMLKNDFKTYTCRSCDNDYQSGFRKAIEEYDPALNVWKVVGEIPNNS